MPVGTFKVGAEFGWLSRDELDEAFREYHLAWLDAERRMRQADKPYLRWPVGDGLVPTPTADTYITLRLGPLSGWYWSVMSLMVTPADPATSTSNIRSMMYFIPSGWGAQQGVPEPYAFKDFTDAMPDVMQWSEDQMACPAERRIVLRLSGSGLVAGTRFFANAFCLEKSVREVGVEPTSVSLNGAMAAMRD